MKSKQEHPRWLWFEEMSEFENYKELHKQPMKEKGKIMEKTLITDAIDKAFMAKTDVCKAMEGKLAAKAFLAYIDHRFDALGSNIFRAQITTMPDNNYSDEKIVADIDYELSKEARNDTLATDRIARLANRIEFYGRTDAEFAVKNRYWEARVAYLRHGDFPNPGIDRNSPAFTKILQECVEMIRSTAISDVKTE